MAIRPASTTVIPDLPRTPRPVGASWGSPTGLGSSAAQGSGPVQHWQMSLPSWLQVDPIAFWHEYTELLGRVGTQRSPSFLPTQGDWLQAPQGIVKPLAVN